MKRKPLFLVGVLTAMVASVSIVVKSSYDGIAWGDEVGTVDTAVNMILNGEWLSYNWPYSYQPLHIILLNPWLKLFGISHVSVCAFNVLWALFSLVLLLRIMDRRGWLQSLATPLALNVVFWFSHWNCWIFGSGRIDPMVMFFTIGTADALLDDLRSDKFNRALIAVFVFLLVLTGVYSLPVLFVLGLLLLFFPGKTNRREVFVRGIVATGALIAGELCVLGYYYGHKGLLRYLHSTFAHARGVYGGSTPVEAILDDSECLIIWFVSVAAMMYAKCWRPVRWQYVIMAVVAPSLLALSGRYMCYYAWVRSVPVAVLFGYMLTKQRERISIVLLVAISVLLMGSRVVEFRGRCQRAQMALKERNCFVGAVSKINVKHGENVVIPHCLFYYDSVAFGYRTWVRDIGTEDLLYQDLEAKIRKFVAEKIPIGRIRDFVEWYLHEHEEYHDWKLPTHGWIYSRNADELAVYARSLKYLAIDYDVVNSANGIVWLRLKGVVKSNEDSACP